LLGDFILQTISVVLLILPGSIPDWISLGFSSILVFSGALLGYIGLVRFVGIKTSQIHNYIVLGIFTVVHSYFAFIHPNLEVRDINVAIGLLIICSQCAWLMLRRVSQGLRKMTLPVGLVFAIFCLVSIIRIGVIVASPNLSNDFFKTGTYDALILLAYQLLSILLTFSLALMVNRRLSMDMQTEEEKFTKAFHSSSYAITLTRLSDGKILEVNDGFESLIGYSSKEVVGKTTPDLRLWARDKDRTSVIKELSEGKKVLGKEFQFRKKSGKLLTGLFSAEIIMINDQPWVLSSFSDITERKKLEKEILAQFPSENPNPVLRISKAGVILYANAASQPLLETYKSRVGRSVPLKWKRLIVESFKSSTHQEIKVRCGDRLFRCAIFPIPSMGYVNVYGTNITEHKKIEDEKLLLANTIEASLNEIYLFDADTLRFQTVNHGALTNLGYSLKQIKKLTPLDIKPDFTRETFEQLIAPLRNGKNSRIIFETRHLRANGSFYPVEVHYQLFMRAGAGQFLAVTQDITDRKKVEEDLVASQRAAINMMEDAVESRGQLEQVNIGLQKEIKERRKAEKEVRKLNAKLEQRVQDRTAALVTANKELEAFSYSISHDLRTPLRSMTGFSEELLEEHAENLEPKTKDYLQRISEAARRMGRLVDDLLRLSRVSRSEIKKQKVDLSAMVRNITEDLQTTAPERIVDWKIEPNIIAMVDKGLIQIALSNLVGNAWKFTGKRNSATIEFGCKKDENELVYYVKDNGAGFDIQYAEKMFDPFQRLHSTAEFAGEGIGLSLVQRIINRHGGKIWAEGKVNKGTTFHFTLPQ
jgi:PAS domain S-box-containing protein